MLRYILLGICLLAGLSTYAQNDLEDNSVTVVTNFEASLTDAERVRVNPVPPPADTSSRRQTYTIVPRPLAIDYPAPTIRPRALQRAELPPINNAWVKLGLGVPNALYADASYDLTGQDNLDLGFYGNHYSFNNNNQVENQRASDTRLGAAGDYLFDQGFAVGGNIEYDTRSRYYYGYNFSDVESDSALTFTNDEVRQRFNTFSLSTELYNGTRTQGNIDYRAGLSLYLMSADPSVRESNLDVDLSGTKWIDDSNPLDVDFKASFTSFKDTASQSLNVVSLSPSYTLLVADRVKLKAGARLVAQRNDFDVFPNFTASAVVIDGLLSAFAGVEGNVQKNTLRTLSDYNPWINTRMRIRNSEATRFYGGVEGTFRSIAYRAEAGYKYLDNLALFLTERDLRGVPKFRVLYDDGSQIYFQGTATLPLVEGLDLNASFTQRFYSMEDEEKPWHLPSLSLNAAGIYTLRNLPLQLRADLFVENGLPYRTPEGQVDHLNALLDLSLNAEYTITDTFGAWVRVNNLLNNKRERFYQYPTIGTNFMVGGSARF
ncbi:TonB-dependent receptor [Lewinella sp. IMCC34183]|uniref:TonB-dependent receptor n=1 Tax=Lewinella sp. IMCC34183 TaxID=2248762 RepID=UPI000E250DEE|nr:TonB-dependent receptor [Lewinella sp. IMCC34183]